MFKLYHVSMVGKPAKRRHQVENARLLALVGLLLACMAARPVLAWEHWGGDAGGTRFSSIAQITPANVNNLVRAWEFHTGDLETRPAAAMASSKFEATPLFVEDSLVFCTPFNEVIALDLGTGAEKWRFDPHISTTQRPANRFNCRGVAYWTAPHVFGSRLNPMAVTSIGFINEYVAHPASKSRTIFAY
jgi:quinoprotein glucose dehydrogenase